jgi:hypothetical protein
MKLFIKRICDSLSAVKEPAVMVMMMVHCGSSLPLGVPYLHGWTFAETEEHFKLNQRLI